LRCGQNAYWKQANCRQDDDGEVGGVDPSDAFLKVGAGRRRPHVTAVDQQSADNKERSDRKLGGEVYVKCLKSRKIRERVHVEQRHDRSKDQTEAIEVVLVKVGAAIQSGCLRGLQGGSQGLQRQSRFNGESVEPMVIEMVINPVDSFDSAQNFGFKSSGQGDRSGRCSGAIRASIAETTWCPC
jgi:hypothetical protein